MHLFLINAMITVLVIIINTFVDNRHFTLIMCMSNIILIYYHHYLCM